MYTQLYLASYLGKTRARRKSYLWLKRGDQFLHFTWLKNVPKCSNENLSLNEGDTKDGSNFSGQQILLSRPKEFSTIRQSFALHVAEVQVAKLATLLKQMYFTNLTGSSCMSQNFSFSFPNIFRIDTHSKNHRFGSPTAAAANLAN